MRLPALLCLFVLASPLAAQLRDSTPATDRSEGKGLVDLFGGSGLSIGNSSRWNGLRINWRDRGLRQVNGVNVTFWKASKDANTDAKVNGIALGLVGPEAGSFNGITLGLGAVAEHHFAGVSVGLLGLVSQGGAYGINVGGLGLVTEGRMLGVNIGGLGLVSEGDVAGINIGGLGLVSEHALRGLNVGGLAAVSNGSVTGLNAAGLALVGNDRVTGINVAGLAVVTGSRMTGFAGSIGAVRAEAVRGFSVAAWVRSDDLGGLTVGGYNETRGPMRGLAIGLYNSAYELHGIQVGLLNRAKNNKPPFRYLPLLNLHLN